MKSLGAKKPEEFDQLAVIHNARYVGDVYPPTTQMIDFDIWKKYYDPNVFSPAVLNGVLINIFSNKKIKKNIIITSLCGITSFK